MSTTIATATTAIAQPSRPVFTLPSARSVFSNLFKADLTSQWRNRRASIMVILIPSIILISWKGIVSFKGGAFVLSNCITFGLNAIGLMGYSNAIARDRDKGIFQRLRITPAPRWTIIASRLAVQLVMILVTTLILYLIAYQFDHILLSPSTYLLGTLAAVIGGATYLGLGQMIVAFVKNPETVNVTSRMVFFLFIMVGQFATWGLIPEIQTIAEWSPYGTTQKILAAAFTPGGWNSHASLYLLASLGYTALFAIVGIRYFKWSTK